MRRAITILLLAIACCLVVPALALADPLYDVKATWGDTNLVPGDTKTTTTEGQFVIQVRNIGDAVGGEDLVIEDQLPGKVTVTAIHWPDATLDPDKLCTGMGTGTVKCTVPAAILPTDLPAPGNENNGLAYSAAPTGYLGTLYIDVSVPANAVGTGTNIATVKGGGAPSPATDSDQVPFNKAPISFGLVPGSFFTDFFTDAYPFGEPARQASDRPFELRVKFDLNLRTGVNDYPGGDGTRYTIPVGSLRTVETVLPRGFIGNPEATPKCDPTVFSQVGAVPNSTACPPNTQVGYLNVPVNDGTRNHGAGQLSALDWGLVSRVPIYNLKPPAGVLADFGINSALVQAHIYPALDPARGYAVKAVTPNVSSLIQVRGSEVVFWGVPGDPAHDRFRYYSEVQEGDVVTGAPFTGAPIRPLLTNPMDCGEDNGGTRIRIDSYNHPGQFTSFEEHGSPLNVSGCDDPRFSFEPEISLQPSSLGAGGPTGLDVHLKVPQRNDEVANAEDLYAVNGQAEAIATPPIKKAVVTLPQGMTISPSAAQGLDTCSPDEIGLGTELPVRCPNASQYGTLIVKSPALPQDELIEGRVYLAEQGSNPFNSLFAIYLVIADPDLGLLVKLAGKVELDPDTGQIVTTFEGLPQLPVSDMQMTLKSGARAALVNPSTCGLKKMTAEFFSWHDPATPRVVESSYQITHEADGSPCVNNIGERLFSPDLAAGTLDNTAGAYSPFLLSLTRADDEQEFSQLGLSLPKGLAAKIAGVTECPEAGVRQAIARTTPGEGRLEQASPSCPASSYVGFTDVGSGVGAPLTFVPGKVYLAGPYRGAPLSMVAITPAVVGPYDLGVIAIRSAIDIDSETAEVSVRTDPLPQILQGVPVRVRDIRVKVDRPETTLNPTDCSVKQIAARVAGSGESLGSPADDVVAVLTERFQATRCARLGFKPKLSLRLLGGTRRGAHPKLRAVLRMPGSGANISRAAVALPRSEFLDQSHIRTVCTRVQFAAEACPRGSIYGFAKAKSPLLDEPLEGPIYLRSSSNTLPDLVMALKGRIDIDVVGRIDSIRQGIRNTFEVVPDAPVNWVVVTFQGGEKGLLINSRNLCKSTARASARFVAQNDRSVTLRPKMRASCGKDP